jgi:hypothetical protein
MMEERLGKHREIELMMIKKETKDKTLITVQKNEFTSVAA